MRKELLLVAVNYSLRGLYVYLPVFVGEALRHAGQHRSFVVLARVVFLREELDQVLRPG